ncbi:hypothetical protein [Chlorogloeopsis fritschii]|uniref:type II toxin-antitoxin system RelN family antitoxin n=1 Tax=Chlorogloeopsis fritschii TaxID=1124 RepID=UPI0030B842BC
MSKGNSLLDVPLSIDQNTRVKVIVLLCEEAQKDNNQQEDEEITESPVESFRQGWFDAMTGNTLPIYQLWNGIDAG